MDFCTAALLQLLFVLATVTAFTFTRLQTVTTQKQRGDSDHVTQTTRGGRERDALHHRNDPSSFSQTRLHLFGFGGKKDPGSQPRRDKERKSDPKCRICEGKGAVKCTAGKCINGIDKTYGSVLERFTCKYCKGFGLVPCKCTGSTGLTPEQSGER